MALAIKIDPVAKDIAVIVRDDLSRAAQAEVMAEFARAGFLEADALNRSILGRSPPHTTTVDGRKNAPLETVNPNGGTIIFEWEFVTDLLLWIAKTLAERSPSISGNYKRGHTLFADGQEVPVGNNIPQAEEYTFTNTVPYARKIEIGKTESGRAFVVQVPNRIYERTAKDARARFGNVAKIMFTYRGIVGGAQIDPLKARHAGMRAHNRSELRYPTIIVRLK